MHALWIYIIPAYIRLIPPIDTPSQTQFRPSTRNAEQFRLLKRCNKLASAHQQYMSPLKTEICLEIREDKVVFAYKHVLKDAPLSLILSTIDVNVFSNIGKKNH